MPALIVQLILLVVSYAISALLAPKPVKPKPAALEDFTFPVADEGTPQFVIFGDAWSEGPQVLWYGNYRTKKIKAGGKK